MLAVAFVVLLLFFSSAGLLPHSALPSVPAGAAPYVPPQSDKALHFICFFTLTSTFYFILDTTRRRAIHLTLVVCTLVLSVGSEVVQGLLPNDREFDAWDVLANVIGSLSALGLCNLYHRRAADRKRRAKYSALTGESLEGDDLELGVVPGMSGPPGTVAHSSEQESGIVSTVQHKSVENELANWDENAPDETWDEDDDATAVESTRLNGTSDLSKKQAVD